MYLIHPIESKIIKGTQNNLCENWGEVRFFILGAKTAEDNAITQIDLTKLSTAEVKKYSERKKLINFYIWEIDNVKSDRIQPR